MCIWILKCYNYIYTYYIYYMFKKKSVNCSQFVNNNILIIISYNNFIIMMKCSTLTNRTRETVTFINKHT